MHAAPIYRIYRSFRRHHEAPPGPETRLLRVGVVLPALIARVVAWVERVVGLSPVAGDRAHRVFDEVGAPGRCQQVRSPGE